MLVSLEVYLLGLMAVTDLDITFACDYDVAASNVAVKDVQLFVYV